MGVLDSLSSLAQESGLTVTLETSLTPALTLVGGSDNAAVDFLTTLLKPTVRVNGSVVYAPAGEAPQALGWIPTLSLAAFCVVGIVSLLKRKGK